MAAGFAFIFAILFLILFVANLIFYAPFILSLYLSFIFFDKRRFFIGSITLIIGISPIFYYYYSKHKLYSEFQDRVSEVNSWPRKPVPEKGAVKAILVNSGWIDLELLELGIVDTVAAQGHVYQRDWGEQCVTKAHAQENLSGATRARNAFFSCPKIQASSNHLKWDAILYDRSWAPSQNKKCAGRYPEDVVELRWATEKGGELIAYHETPYKRELKGPWISPNKKESLFLIECVKAEPSKPFDNLAFVTNALGYDTLDDYPQYAVSVDALKALRILNAEKNNKTNEAIMLLGQWPSTPEISKFIRTEMQHGEWTYKVLSRMTSKKGNFELLPHLKSHAADFIAICPKTTRNPKDCERLAEKLQASS